MHTRQATLSALDSADGAVRRAAEARATVEQTVGGLQSEDNAATVALNDVEKALDVRKRELDDSRRVLRDTTRKLEKLQEMKEALARESQCFMGDSCRFAESSWFLLFLILVSLCVTILLIVALVQRS